MMKRIIALVLCICCLVIQFGCSVPEEYRYINPTESCPWEPTDSPEEEATTPPADNSTDPAPTTTEAPRLSARQLAEKMELEDLVAQLFLVKCPPDGAEKLLREYHVGGIILDETDLNGSTPDSLAQKLTSWQEFSPIPLIIAVSEEGGNEVCLSSREAFRSKRFDAPRSIYYDGGLYAIRETEAEKAQLLKRCGINVNLAPVCDVPSLEDATMASRSLFQTPKTTGKVVAAMVKTMQKNGVGAVLKHFPGYGDITEDTRDGKVVDTRDKDRFQEYDFIPFQYGIQAGAGAIIVSHVTATKLDEQDPIDPASLSTEVHWILRRELGFQGVILTDDLQMRAIASHYAPETAAVKAIQCGNDMIITGWSEEVYDAICSAVGITISEEQLIESVTRIIQWKMDLGLM